jgi:hypothetical protein
VPTPGSASGAGTSAGRFPDGLDSDSNCTNFLTESATAWPPLRTPVRPISKSPARQALVSARRSGLIRVRTSRLPSSPRLARQALPRWGPPLTLALPLSLSPA